MHCLAHSRRTVSELMRRWAATACLLAFSLIVAPWPRALRVECEICPPKCPMHEGRGAPEDGHPDAPMAAPMKCHGAPAAAASHGDTGKGPKLSRPSCGSHSGVAAPGVPPMILPPALPVDTIAAAGLRPSRSSALHQRATTPPETPPPILPV
jgi:hypothetical protein